MEIHMCGECGAPASHFTGETFCVKYNGLRTDVTGLSGWRCGGCDEVEFEHESAIRYAAAGDELIRRVRVSQAKDLRRIRERLGMTQATAASLTGGGHNAFSRYEKGLISPMAAVLNLFRLLDKHPDLLDELDIPVAATSGSRSRNRHQKTERSCAAVQS